MEQWRDYFSDTQQTYKALNLTLDNLPGGIPAHLLNSLSRVHLCRPITDRLELMLLLCAIEEGLPQPQLQRLQFTHRREILHAMSFASEKTGLRLSPRKSVDVGRFARLLRELSEPSTKALLGLTRQALQKKGERERSHLVDERRVQLPPVSLPDSSGLTFLGTVGEIHRAAREFNNCLASRVEQALKGECFLFRYEHDQIAVAEVTPSGRVAQSLGPRNQMNPAARELQAILASWGQQFPTSTSNPDVLELGF